MDVNILAAFSQHMAVEFYSAYLYYSLSGDFAVSGLDGFAHWMRLQALEELTHGERFFRYLVSRGETPELLALDSPPTGHQTAEQAIVAAREHEKLVSNRIDDLVTLTCELRDRASASFLQWFVIEQVEEEAQIERIHQRLKIAGESGHGLLLLDRELGHRQ
jgi:ferritin